MKKFTAFLFTASILAFAGCDRANLSSSGSVAVVDLDAVAQKLGKDKQILQLIEQRQMSLNEQLAATQNSLLQQLNQKKSEFGEISDEEAKELTQLQVRANTIVATTRTQAQTDLTNFQQEVINRFRAEAKPIVMELAAKKGCRLVLSKNDSVVFAFDTTVDLTDEVVSHLQAKASSSTSSPSETKGNQAPAKQASTGSRRKSRGNPYRSGNRKARDLTPRPELPRSWNGAGRPVGITGRLARPSNYAI